MQHNANIDKRPIGPRYAIRLADLREWHVITVVCDHCRHQGRVPLKLLIRGLPGHTKLMDVERRLVCKACGNRRGNRISVSMMDRG